MIIQADARQIPLRDKSVQCVVTSPPYWGLRDYGMGGQIGIEKTPEEYVSNIVAVFREVRRVLRDDGTLWLNLGDSYAGSGMTGGINSKESSEKRIERMFHGSRRDTVPGLKQKDLVGIPWRVAFALQADGWYLRSDIIWSKPNPMPESVTDRPTKAHEYIFLLSKSERYYFDQESVKEPAIYGDPRSPTAAYPGKNDYREGPRPIRESVKRCGFNGKTNELSGREAFRSIKDWRNIRTVWEVATQPFSEAHFATFPEDLIKPCILAGAPAGGIVFDPFVGSGTVVKVAQDLGRIGVGCDLKAEYLQMAKRRSSQQGFGNLLREAL